MNKHIPVMVKEVLTAFQPQSGQMYLDATAGYGGHIKALLQSANVTVIGVDKDQQALDSLVGVDNLQLRQGSYNLVADDLIQEGYKFDGILLDLGLSSPQLDQAQRGFSLKNDGPLDMRFDLSSKKTAAEILSTYQVDELAEIFYKYGEEKFAKRLALSIVKQRQVQALVTTSDLRALVEREIPKKLWPKAIHPATRIFQALRIEVNSELKDLENALPKMVDLLKPQGKLATITFHSLEDRIVKHFFRLLAKDCVCPPILPVCRCEHQAKLKIMTTKPILPTKIEIKNNVRSRSAKLRVAERL